LEEIEEGRRRKEDCADEINLGEEGEGIKISRK